MSQTCSNCGSVLTGPYCANCGQAARSRRGSVAQMVADVSEDVLRFDSKFYRSILHLMIKPGFLSTQFINGKRVSILPPIRMYLVISLLFFFVFDIPIPNVENSNVYIGNILVGKDQPDPNKGQFNIITYQQDGSKIDQWLQTFLNDKLESLQNTDPQLVVDRIFNRLEDVVPNVLILFMPIFALLLKLLYLFKNVLYFDHLIFSLHFQSWLMVMILIIYGLAQYHLAWTALSMLVPIYLAKSQKVVYEQSYWLVIPKTIFIFLMYLFMLTIATVLAFLAAIALL